MEIIYSFLLNLIGNDMGNSHYVWLLFIVLCVLCVIMTKFTFNLSIFLILPLFCIFIGFEYHCAQFQNTMVIKNAESYMDSIKQERASGKNIIIVDTRIIGSADRSYMIEFEKEMAEANYKAQSSHDGIVVYRKVNEVN